MNYWDGWTQPDDNSDGFVDGPYSVYPYGKINRDNSPLTIPVNSTVSLPIVSIKASSSKATSGYSFHIIVLFGIIVFGRRNFSRK